MNKKLTRALLVAVVVFMIISMLIVYTFPSLTATPATYY